MRKLSPARRRAAVLAGSLAAVAAGSAPLLHRGDAHEDLAFGLLFGVGLGLMLLVGLRARGDCGRKEDTSR